MHHTALWLPITVVLLVTGCDQTRTERLVGVADEKEANEIVVLLHQLTGCDNIEKCELKGQREREWVIEVPPKVLDLAREILADHGLPRAKRPSLAEPPPARGLVLNDMEDRARQQAALAGDIELLVLKIPRIIDAKVTLNLPMQDILADQPAPPPSISIVATYRIEPDRPDGSEPPVPASELQRIVARAVPGLLVENVEVLLASYTPRVQVPVAAAVPPVTPEPPPRGKPAFSWTTRYAVQLSVAIGLIGLASALLLVSAVQRRSRKTAQAAALA